MTKNEIRLFTIQDLFEEQDKQVPVDITKVYDPLHFWDDFGDKYFKSFKKMPEIQHNVAWLVHKLKSLNVKNVLDAGCGFCRLEPFLLDAKVCEKVTGIDISQKQLDSSEEYLKDYTNKDKITLVKASVKNIPFVDNEFDCVFSSECLMHIQPNKILPALYHLRRVTKQYCILIERYMFPGEHPHPHIWSHDYLKFAGDVGFQILESKAIANGVIGIVLKK